MEVKLNPPGDKDIEMWSLKRMADGMKNKRGIEELTDREIGPDVRYVLQANDIDMVKRYLRAPITVAEYRELYHKLIELQGQQVAGQKLGKIRSAEVENKKEIETDFGLTPELKDIKKTRAEDLEEEKIVNLVA